MVRTCTASRGHVVSAHAPCKQSSPGGTDGDHILAKGQVWVKISQNTYYLVQINILSLSATSEQDWHVHPWRSGHAVSAHALGK